MHYTHMTAAKTSEVSAVFSAFPEPARQGLLALRTQIYSVAAADPRIGILSESLKWGQPSYGTPHSKSGTPLRLGIPKVGGYAIFVHCQTTVVSEFRHIFGEQFSYDGSRAVIFRADTVVDMEKVSVLINRALTYRL